MKLSQFLAVVFFLFFCSSCSLLKGDLSKKEDVATEDDDGRGWTKDKTVRITAEGGGELRTTKNTFSSAIEVKADLIEEKELATVYEEAGYELEYDPEVVVLDPVRLTLGSKDDEAFTIEEPLSYALPASALPASLQPDSGWVKALPASALPASALPAAFKNLKGEHRGSPLQKKNSASVSSLTQIYAIATLLDPSGAAYGSPFNTQLFFADDTLLAIITPEMLVSTTIKGGSSLVITVLIVPPGRSATLNLRKVEEVPYMQEKIKPIAIVSVRGNGSGDDIFRNALIVEAEQFGSDDRIFLRDLDGQKRIDLEFTIDSYGQIIALLPEDIVPGHYQLKLLGLAGSDKTEIEILKGEPGLGITWLGSFVEAPLEPALNDAYYDISNGASFVYDGSDWMVMAMNGAPGADGSTGPMGEVGQTGQQGEQGLPGEPGPAGISLTWLGTLADDPVNPLLNTAYYNSMDRVSYIFDGTSWQLLTSDGIDGSDGAIGPQGEQGPIGPEGATGATGLTGEPGTEGAPGPQGETGATGPQGETGPTGPSGQDGADGTQGTSGLDGNDGISIVWLGSLADTPTSPQLNQAYYDTIDGVSYIYNGLTWMILAQDGSDGTQGAIGPAGPAGAVGPVGNVGPAGATGVAGPQGETGPAGQDGLDGTNGSDGISLVWKGSLATAPDSPQTNWAYYNSTAGISYIFDGDSWEILSQDGADGTQGELVLRLPPR